MATSHAHRNISVISYEITEIFFIDKQVAHFIVNSVEDQHRMN